jgi:hypothetical protein
VLRVLLHASRHRRRRREGSEPGIFCRLSREAEVGVDERVRGSCWISIVVMWKRREWLVS